MPYFYFSCLIFCPLAIRRFSPGQRYRFLCNGTDFTGIFLFLAFAPSAGGYTPRCPPAAPCRFFTAHFSFCCLSVLTTRTVSRFFSGLDFKKSTPGGRKCQCPASALFSAGYLHSARYQSGGVPVALTAGTPPDHRFLRSTASLPADEPSPFLPCPEDHQTISPSPGHKKKQPAPGSVRNRGLAARLVIVFSAGQGVKPVICCPKAAESHLSQSAGACANRSQALRSRLDSACPSPRRTIPPERYPHLRLAQCMRARRPPAPEATAVSGYPRHRQKRQDLWHLLHMKVLPNGAAIRAGIALAKAAVCAPDVTTDTQTVPHLSEGPIRQPGSSA